jgi:hypothetical protein
MVKTHLTPGRSRTLRRPLFASTLRRQIANPSPRPDLSPPHCVNGMNIFSVPPGGTLRSNPRRRFACDRRQRRHSTQCRSVLSELERVLQQVPDARQDMSRSASTARVGSTEETVSSHSWSCASSEAALFASATRPATEINWRRAGNPAVTRTSARERSGRGISMPSSNARVDQGEARRNPAHVRHHYRVGALLPRTCGCCGTSTTECFPWQIISSSPLAHALAAARKPDNSARTSRPCRARPRRNPSCRGRGGLFAYAARLSS